MARNQEETAPVEANTAPVVEGAAAAAPVKTGDERFSKIQLDEAAAGQYGVEGTSAGAIVNRKDFIVRLWGQGKSRSEIKNEVNRLAAIEGNATKEIAYQIVFQATKGVEGGPAPVAPAAAPTEAAPAASE